MSRYGLVQYSSSSDCIGPLGHSVHDLFTMFSAIEGPDDKDSNCIDFAGINESFKRDREKVPVSGFFHGPLSGVRVGILEEFLVDEETDRSRAVQ